MILVQTLLSLISAVITIYTLLCFIDIILSWLPGAKFTGFGKFISSLCDPYLNFFSRWNFLRIGNIDFSPIISIGLLSLVSSIVGGINSTGRIYVGGILATIIYMLWNVVSSLISILFLVILIRWIILLINKGQTAYDSAWTRIDQMVSQMVFRIANSFVKSNISYQKALMVTWIALGVFLMVGRILISILVSICYRIPF